MKKFMMIAIGILVPSIAIATLSEQKLQLIDHAAERIVTVMHQNNISPVYLVTTIRTLEEKFSGDDWKYQILEVLLTATLDNYYQVKQFMRCENYYDGCNTCIVGDKFQLTCTKKMCVHTEKPRCEKYKNDIATLCQNEGGQWDEQYKECAGISQQTCENNEGTWVSCGSACRHDPDAVVCTLQCAIYCDFSQQ